MITTTNNKNSNVGRIDYLSNKGHVAYSTEYTNKKELIGEVLDALEYGIPIIINVYRGNEGVIDQNFIDDLSCLPKGYRVIDYV